MSIKVSLTVSSFGITFQQIRKTFQRKHFDKTFCKMVMVDGDIASLSW